jgi:hypothetical protein
LKPLVRRHSRVLAPDTVSACADGPVCISLAAALVHGGGSEEAITASQRARTLLRETRGQRDAAKGVGKPRRRGR